MSLGTPVRSGSATYFLPTENEWYKAAYYDPGAGSPASDYWLYPMQSDTVSGNAVGAGEGKANYKGTFYSVTQSATYDANQNYLTDGGAYTESASYYGTFDQGGNVREWNETLDAANRGVRGGAWNVNTGLMKSSYRGSYGPTTENDVIGFRIASVPEPSAALLMIMGGVAMLARRRRTIALRKDFR